MANNGVAETETWGTWEELLLACAVSRHGTNRWDSVAIEIQNRSSTLHLLTAQNCKQKYHDLKRRFTSKDDKTNEREDDSETNDKKDVMPWLEELRKLRVAELRREVERYDVSIVSLQLKVKRLKEERERSLREKENSVEKPDLEKDSEKFRAKEEQKERDDEPEKSSPENVDGKPVTDEESDRENQSFNESNSTDPKGGTPDNGVEEPERKREPVETITGRPDPVSGDLKPTGEGSCNGSSDTVPKESAAPPVGKSSGSVKAREAGDSPELWESMAESKGGGDEETKANSDVQSSASLSKKNRRKAISGSSSGDEPETEEVSPAIKRISVKSEPLMFFLEIIRSHKYGSVFERRLDSQDTTKYTSLVRQHVDLELVQSRLDEGRYNSCSSKFFRDLLLLFNNAIVFFAKYSPESAAAIALRELVTKEMANRNTKKPDTSADDEPPQLPPVPLPTKLSSEPTDSLFAKPKSIGPIIACRKRSSISAKASTAAMDRKGDQKPSTIGATATAVIDEKPLIDAKQADNVADEKKRMRDRLTTSGTRSLRVGNKSRATTTTSKNLNANSSQSPGRSSSPPSGKGGVAPEDSPEPKVEKKNNNTTAVAKKRSATNFLNRMKRNSSSNGALLETLKSSVNGSNNNKGVAGGVEQKKISGKSDGRKDQSPQQGSGGKHAREQRNPAKRSVGRPPKKAMRQTSLPPPVPSKRVRETVETEAVTSRQATKRKRR